MWADAIINFIQTNPLLFLALCFMLYKQWQARQPWCASSLSMYARKMAC